MKKWMSNFMKVFFISAHANVAYNVKKITHYNLLCKWLYLIFPMLITSFNILVMIRNNILWNFENECTYLLDVSNSIGLTFLFFISYFLSGVYTEIFYKTIEDATTRDEFKLHDAECSKLKIIAYILAFILLVLGYVLGYSFVRAAKVNGLYWVQQLDKNDPQGMLFYTFYLTLTWQQSLCLLVQAASGILVLYGVIKNKLIIYYECLYKNNISIIRIYNMIMYNISYSLFYIGGSVLFIINDNIRKILYHTNSTFANPTYAVILLMIVFSLALFAFIPLYELKNYMNIQKNNYIEFLVNKLKIRSNSCFTSGSIPNVDQKITLKKELDEVIMSSPILITFTSRIALAISTITPIIGIIIQIIAMFINKSK